MTTPPRDPELDALLSNAVTLRDHSTDKADYQAMETVIDAITAHPYFRAKRSAALDRMAAALDTCIDIEKDLMG